MSIGFTTIKRKKTIIHVYNPNTVTLENDHIGSESFIGVALIFFAFCIPDVKHTDFV